MMKGLGTSWRWGQRLQRLASDFDPRTYGEGKLSDLVEKAGSFELRRTDTGHLQIRVSPSGKMGQPTAKKAKSG
nr:OST-HTH/LOTUS domain-containing protein [Rhizorhabdus wittichii]